MKSFHDDTLKEFDEKFPFQRDIGNQNRNKIKSFLTTRHTAYQNLLVERLIELEKEMLPNFPKDIEGITEETARLKEIVGHNQALFDIIALIKTL